MLRDILDSDELWSHYVFYPDAFSYGVALRLDGPRRAAVAAAFRARWEACFPGHSMAEHVARRAPPAVFPDEAPVE
jgi:hypothetical protein